MWYSLLKLQTLSQSVGNAMEMQGRHDTKSTIKFIKTFNKTFDCLNVMTTNSRGSMNKLPYKSKEDPRFEVIYLYCSLLSEFSLFHPRLVPFLKLTLPFVFPHQKSKNLVSPSPLTEKVLWKALYLKHTQLDIPSLFRCWTDHRRCHRKRV